MNINDRVCSETAADSIQIKLACHLSTLHCRKDAQNTTHT